MTETTEPTGLDFSTVTLDMAMGALSDVVEAAGLDFVYEPEPGAYNCRYVHGDAGDARPGCIVGRALHRLGAPLGQLASHEGEAVSGMYSLAYHVREVLGAAQAVQDAPYISRPATPEERAADLASATWGHALLAAHHGAVHWLYHGYTNRERVLAVLGPMAP